MTDSPFLQDEARTDELVLVDGLDQPIGHATKERAHREGLLHRAFSVVFVRNGERGTELLLSQRAMHKYHSGGLWANACCSHPRLGEDLMDAAFRRVREELGVEAHDLRELGSFVYRAAFANELAEYEYDHVLLGTCAGSPAPNPSEVSAVRWVTTSELAYEMAERPERFCAWAFTVLSLAMQACA